MENYSHIYYLDCPHFTVGKADQWGENGYLFYEGDVYSYEEDRKNQWGRTYCKMSIEEFISYANKTNLTIPEDFKRHLEKN